MAETTSLRRRPARRPLLCDDCSRIIDVGERYAYCRRMGLSYVIGRYRCEHCVVTRRRIRQVIDDLQISRYRAGRSTHQYLVELFRAACECASPHEFDLDGLVRDSLAGWRDDDGKLRPVPEERP